MADPSLFRPAPVEPFDPAELLVDALVEAARPRPLVDVSGLGR